MTIYRADTAWLPQGWEGEAVLEVRDGCFAAVDAERTAAAAQPLGRWVLPGMPNLHSHAFQRAMAGLAERQTHPEDSFWTWRETMYAFAGRVGPDELRAIAAQLYVEMLEAGYTQVCEFHYLHHQPDAQPYADAAAMSLALIEAAQETGIGLTLLPTLYQTGGFDGRPLAERQRRFGHATDAYLALVQRLRALEGPNLRVGVALHSLRAVPQAALQAVLDSGLVDAAPIHIHIAEQLGEVQDCLALRNARPVEWLLANAPVDARWTLVHATHLTEQETAALAASGAVAGLCPTTEANLGDGLFPLKSYLDAGGVLGIGSDSHISVSPVEELRWLEYGQRLVTRHRNIAVSESSSSVGETLWGDALFGGARAAGLALGALEAGARADLIVLDENAAQLAGRGREHLLDSWLFSGNRNLVKDVMVNGRWCVRDGRHPAREAIAARYAAAIAAIGAV
ncbi:formimidoylglutamate deiminase [Tahibacter harae]|uniref:Formimidoylglutamate deiminase n=1 Tax=Tahibacter harae TaxID=2963937 RepID=A0ABT1QSN1_9GAMM|nr:formimidoylglutamate deiminase [Tahibacter harae]MCQ4165279.1 formimidoylglutamate deiminase [Tahibacter harae]